MDNKARVGFSTEDVVRGCREESWRKTEVDLTATVGSQGC